MRQALSVLSLLGLLLFAVGTSSEPELNSTDPGGQAAPAEAAEPATPEAPELDPFPADCAGGQPLFRCGFSEDGQTGARLCLHASSEGTWLTGSLLVPDSPAQDFAQRLGHADGAVGWCRYTSPLMSHQAAYVGSSSPRLAVRSLFVNPDATEFHGEAPHTLPREPRWTVYAIDADGERAAACQGETTVDLSPLEAHPGLTESMQEGCEGFGQLDAP